MNRTILGVLNESFKQRSPCERTFQLSSRDLETLERFRMRTAFTLGNTSTRDIFQRSGFRLALEVRYQPAPSPPSLQCSPSDA